MHIRDDIAFNTRPDLEVEGLKATWVELLLPKTKGILVCGCYRPPKVNTFLNKMEQSLAEICNGVEFYVLGDINIDLSKLSSLRDNYQDEFDLFSCGQLN